MSFGISITITAELVGREVIAEAPTFCTNEVVLYLQAPGLIDEEKKWLEWGITLASPLVRKVTAVPIYVCVSQLEFGYCDCQEEGFACVMLGWLAQELGFEPPAVVVRYDKPTNRHLFVFPQME